MSKFKNKSGGYSSGGGSDSELEDLFHTKNNEMDVDSDMDRLTSNFSSIGFKDDRTSSGGASTNSTAMLRSGSKNSGTYIPVIKKRSEESKIDPEEIPDRPKKSLGKTARTDEDNSSIKVTKLDDSQGNQGNSKV